MGFVQVENGNNDASLLFIYIYLFIYLFVYLLIYFLFFRKTYNIFVIDR